MRFQKVLCLAVSVAALGGGSTTAFAQATASTTANGSVTIIRPITVSCPTDLEFGRIVKPSSGSATIAIANTADTVSAGTGAALNGITTSRAKCTIGGESFQAIDITVGSLTMTGPGGATLGVTLAPDQSSGALLSGAAIGSAGTLALNIGGSFSLPAGQTTGVYSGSFSVDVGYQ